MTIEILQHKIDYWFDQEDLEMDTVDIEYVEEKIKEGYIEGELCQIVDSETGDEARGWWKIIK